MTSVNLNLIVLLLFCLEQSEQSLNTYNSVLKTWYDFQNILVFFCISNNY